MILNIINKPTNFGGGYQKPKRIIIHSMGEYVKGIYAPEWLKSLKYSSHYMICPNGDILKCRDENKMAWHAKGFNTGSIGIEVLVEGNWVYETFLKQIKTEWVTFEEMESCINLCNDICTRHPIKEIVRHSDIDPKRKYDPGDGFDFEYLLSNINL